ncbi:MAG: Nex18 symbiotically induced protein [Pelagibacterales bacterium MED-G44]|nr:MAG: Nex18 symbiotically induced protein [Pelagibacterales bacterium MED-G44]
MKKFYVIVFTLTMIIVPSITFGDVIDKLNETGKFTKLNETLSKSGLNENLKGKGPFTVFAPLDDAFAAISAQTYYGLLREENKDKLVNILGRHVFSQKITSSEIDDEIKLKAINGEEVTIKKVNGIVYINEAEVVTADVETSNGIIHFINRVLQPLN